MYFYCLYIKIVFIQDCFFVSFKLSNTWFEAKWLLWHIVELKNAFCMVTDLKKKKICHFWKFDNLQTCQNVIFSTILQILKLQQFFVRLLIIRQFHKQINPWFIKTLVKHHQRIKKFSRKMFSRNLQTDIFKIQKYLKKWDHF